MEPVTIPDYERGLTFEKVWAAIHASKEAIDRHAEDFEHRIEEMRLETERMRQETNEIIRRNEEAHEKRRQEETERACILAESMAKTEKMIKRNGRQIGGLHNKFGELAEHLVAPGIAKRFNELGYHFDSVSPGGHRILDEQGNTKTEIDILLENGEYIVAVEVKSKPAEKDIPHHIKRLEILREHRDKRNDKRKIRGAIAGAVFAQEVKKAASEAGLYVIEQSGDTMKFDLPGGFIAREW